MSKISIIIQREYSTRVKKKSFIIMTLIAPLLMAAIFIVPVWIMTREDTEEKVIAVVEDGSNFFTNVIPDTEKLQFDYVNSTLDQLKSNFSDKGYYGILYISPKAAYIPNAVQLISHKQPPLDLTIHIANALEKEIEKKKLEAYDIKDLDKILKTVSTDIRVQTIKINEDGQEKETSTGLAMGIAYIGGLLIYLLTFIFGAQVMRGVIEEKTSRVVEVIISSVRPFQLMLGKIIGIGLVGLTQFILWIIITALIIISAQSFLLPENAGSTQEVAQNIMNANPVEQTQVQVPQNQELNEVQQIFEKLHSINWGLIISSFLFFFLGGYFLYASLFASIGSAVDNETDTQQFMMPITIPLILGLFVAMGTFQNPESSIAFWFSLIPFTSPIVMMARLPFGVPYWELILSMSILILTFFGTTWMAAKIYRTGILMYGKKTTYKELWKWIRYKN